MNDVFDSVVLSPGARATRDAMLPGLLLAVRRRRRRRHAVRATALAAFVVAIVLSARAYLGPLPDRGAARAPEVQEPWVASSWTTFRDDPTVSERCVVGTVARAEWFVGDDEVSALLRDAGRRCGIIRAGGRVEVDPAAFDPWPGSRAE